MKYKEVDGSARFEFWVVLIDDGDGKPSHPLSHSYCPTFDYDCGSEINKMRTRQQKHRQLQSHSKETAIIEAHQQQRINITSIIEIL